MSVRKTRIHGQTRLFIDFYYTDQTGARQRFRKVADVQTMTSARAEEDRLRAVASRTGAPFEQPKARLTLSEFVAGKWKTWAARYKPSTRERYLALLDQGILSAFGSTRLDRISATQVNEYAAHLAKDNVQAWPHTSLVSSILRAAVALGELEELPKLPPPYKRKRKLPSCPSTPEVNALLECAMGWLRLAVALSAYAGLRSGEVRALEAHDVDLPRGEMLIRRAMSANHVETTKSDEERRVPIATELEPMLVEAMKGKRGSDRLVLTERHTTPSRQHILERLTRVQERHGLRRHSFHSLRHYFCTSLLRRGADIEVVRTVAGHQDIETTMQYLHARFEDAQRIMSRQPLGNTIPGELN